VTRRKSPPPAENDAVVAYIDAAAEPARTRLRRLRSLVREEAPNAAERMAYGLPTWHQEENLLHLGAFSRHVGFYPGPAAIEAFAEELESFGTSKGAIQLPHNRDLPVDLVRRIVRWRLEQISEKRPPRARPGRAPPKSRTPSRAGEAREQTSRPAASPKEGTKAGPSARRTKPWKLLAGGNPQVAKAEGDAPLQAYISAIPDWKRDIGRRLDALIVRTVPNVRKAVKWNSPFYGMAGQGWFLSFHVFTRYVKVTFFRGTSLQPLPPGASKHKDVRYVDVHEDDLDETQMAKWLQQAAALPGWVP
jgi:hypothetical protein